MARTVENYKGFKVIEISRDEMLDKLTRYGCLGICDMCAKPIPNGYYVAVLNQWLCEDCYRRFIESVNNHEEDKTIEDRNFKNYCYLFNA